MVGQIVGTAAYLSLIALIWIILARSGFSLLMVAASVVLFLVIGAFATFEPGEWQRRKGQL